MSGPQCARCGKPLALGALLKWDDHAKHGMFRAYCRNTQCPMTSGIALVTEQTLSDYDVYGDEETNEPN